MLHVGSFYILQFYPKNGGDKLFQNFSWLLPDYTTLCPRILNYSHYTWLSVGGSGLLNGPRKFFMDCIRSGTPVIGKTRACSLQRFVQQLGLVQLMWREVMKVGWTDELCWAQRFAGQQSTLYCPIIYALNMNVRISKLDGCYSDKVLFCFPYKSLD
jgi:hypothetical protein